jgi:hypothetical protein
VLLGAAYGAVMGLYALTVRGPQGALQILSSALKVPLLFLCTLLVTFPSLYVFSALARSRLTLQQTLRLLLGATAVNLALLASFAPITAFFTLSTDSYPFMITLNVFFFAVAGAVALRFLWRALLGVFESEATLPEPPAATGGEPGASPPPRLVPARGGDAASGVFRVWLLIYGVVGAQMGWLLRPFVGDPALPLALFRQRESNFFAGLSDALGRLLQ